MENEDEKKNLVLEYLELIDVSSEDDFLIAYPFYDSLEDLRLSVKLDNINELFGSANSPQNDNSAEVVQQSNMLSHSESTNRRRPSYLRKSLAWDSAFFTSAGVLDPEELRTVNKGFNNTAEAYLLPGIQEDMQMRRSDDSESMYDSDGFCIKSLDCDAFEDVRASIDNCYKMSSMNFESGFRKSTLHKFHPSKKVEIANQNKVKSTPTSKSQSSIKPQRSERFKREPHAPRSGESNIKSLKPHKLSGGTTPMLARRRQTASLGAYNIKSGSKTKITECVSATPPPKSCSKFSLTASDSSAVSLSSYNTAPSSSSTKYPFSSTRRKLDSRTNTLDSPGFSIHLSLISNSSSQTSPCCSSIDDGLSLESYYSPTPLTNLDSRVQSSTSQEIQETRSTRNLKPSGLRMPSPKIGFFDEKSVGGNVKFQFGVHKANSDVGRSTKPSPESGILKHRSVQYASRIRQKATHAQWLNNDSPLLSAKVKTTRICPVTDSKTKSYSDLSPVMDRGSCSKIRKVGNGERDKRKVVTFSNLKAEETRIKGTMKKSMIIKRKGQRHGTPNLYCENEKENVSNVADEVSCLSRCFEVIDIGRDVTKEVGISNSCGEICGNNPEKGSLRTPNSPLSGTTSIGSADRTRMPLSDRTSVWNRRESREKSA